MTVLRDAFRLFAAKLAIKLGEVTFGFCLPCARGLLALAKALAPEVYRNRDRGERVHWF
jgi:hypothetical protein